MNWLKTTTAMLKREIEWIVKDKDLLIMIFLAPLFYSIFYGTIYIDKAESKVPIAIVDLDNTQKSLEIKKDLSASSMILIKENLNNLNLLQKKLINEEVEGVVVIPENFERDLSQFNKSNIKVFLNTQRFLHSNDLNKAINEIAIREGEKIRIEILQSQGFSNGQAKELATPLKDNIQLLFNPSETYGDFLIPAILLLVLQQTLLFSIGQSAAKERESSGFKDMFLEAKNNIFSIIIGKSAFYSIMFFAYSMLFFSIHFSIFKINFQGNLLVLLFLTELSIIAFSILGLLFGTFFSKKVYALIFLSFTSYPFFFLTGYSWPIFAMPKFIQIITWFVPSTVVFQSLNQIIYFKTTFADFIPDILHLIFLISILFYLLFLRLKYLQKKVLLK